MSYDNPTNPASETSMLRLAVNLGETGVESITVYRNREPPDPVLLPADEPAELRFVGPEDEGFISIEIEAQATARGDGQGLPDPGSCRLRLFYGALEHPGVHTLLVDGVQLNPSPRHFMLEVEHSAPGFQTLEFSFEVWINGSEESSAEIKFDTILSNGPPPPQADTAPGGTVSTNGCPVRSPTMHDAEWLVRAI